MKILYYGTKNNGAGKRLQKAIDPVVPMKEIEVYRDIKELGKRLRLSTSDISISVFCAENKIELFELLLIKELLLKLRIILILPDGDKQTITLAHTLYPRFLTYSDSSFEDVTAVLNKMIRQEHSG